MGHMTKASLPIFDFEEADPEVLCDSKDVELLFRSVAALPTWTNAALSAVDEALTSWITDLIAKAKKPDDVKELATLTQRLQAIHPLREEESPHHAQVFFKHWEQLHRMLKLRAAALLDKGRAAQIAKRRHMPELRSFLQEKGQRSFEHWVSQRDIALTLQLSPSSTSQLLAAAEAAELIEREAHGREGKVRGMGEWAVKATAAPAPPIPNPKRGSMHMHADHLYAA
jgi:MarR family